MHPVKQPTAQRPLLHRHPLDPQAHWGRHMSLAQTEHGETPPGDADGHGLRVLVVHGRYRSAQPSGENEVVDDEVRLLRDHGCKVEQLELQSDDVAGWPLWKKAHLPLRVVWSREGQHLLERALERWKPDVVHIHNTFPLFSPAVFRTARRGNAGVVHTLHNFRPFCPGGAFLREGRACEDCFGRFPLPGIRHGCYRESRLATVPVAVMDGLHGWLGTWQKNVDRLIVVSGYERDKYIAGGWPAAKIKIKYNTVFEKDLPPRQPGRHFMSMSRIVPEKGVDVVLEGFRRAFPDGNPPLWLSAGGDSAGELQAQYEGEPGIRFMGHVSRAELYDALSSALAVVVPSRCYEGFPRVVVEAYAAGVPVIASRVGSLTELVEEGVTGLQVRMGDPDDMARALKQVADSPELAQRMGAGARARYERMYSPEVTMAELFRIYREAIDEHARSLAA
jgi:glycosyltransferase involved in cell wall biosynthesis